MTTPVWYRVAGDATFITAGFGGIDNPDDLTTAVAHVWPDPPSELAAVTLAVDVDTVALTFTIDLSTDDWQADQTGESAWNVEVEAQPGPITWPSNGPGRLFLRAEGA